jgi:hypothetical protein
VQVGTGQRLGGLMAAIVYALTDICFGNRLIALRACVWLCVGVAVCVCVCVCVCVWRFVGAGAGAARIEAAGVCCSRAGLCRAQVKAGA